MKELGVALGLERFDVVDLFSSELLSLLKFFWETLEGEANTV